jgi:hypothetical protein
MPAASVISSSERERLDVEISENEPRYDARWKVRVKTPYLDAVHGFFSGVEPDALVAYFEELAQHWRGWDGVREFASVEHDFKLAAIHDGSGHVELWVTLGTETDYPQRDWLVRVALHFEAGGLNAAAEAVRPLAER